MGASVEVRALAGQAEVEAYFALAAATFPGYQRFHSTPEPGGSLAAGWRQFVLETPGFDPASLRGAFRDGALLGGLIHEQRQLYVGAASLPSGYIGGVVVDPRSRGQGVASALMRASTELARQRAPGADRPARHSRLLRRLRLRRRLRDGRAADRPGRRPGQARPRPAVRPAAEADAPALLALYERHYAGRTGAYARALPLQRHLLRHRREPPRLALDGRGRPRGYLIASGAGDGSGAVEAAADDWPAALALLRWHATARGEPPAQLRWPLPLDGPTYYLLAEHLPLRTEIRSRPERRLDGPGRGPVGALRRACCRSGASAGGAPAAAGAARSA